MAVSTDLAFVKEHLVVYPGFPTKDVHFVDIFPLLRNPLAFEALISHFVLHITTEILHKTPNRRIDVVVGLDARGFLLGPSLAGRLGAAFVPVRKKGKLPGSCLSATYAKEYGQDVFQMQEGVIKPGQSVIVVDDTIATGGSAAAAGDLVSRQGGKTLAYLFVVEFLYFNGRDKLDAPTHSVLSLAREDVESSEPERDA